MESELRQGIPTDNEIIHLTVDITKTWRKLGLLLGLTEPQLDQIEGDHTTDIGEQSYVMLKRWRECEGSAATYGKLAEALNHNSIDRSDLCMKYCVAKHGGKFLRCMWGKQLCFVFFVSLFPPPSLTPLYSFFLSFFPSLFVIF